MQDYESKVYGVFIHNVKELRGAIKILMADIKELNTRLTELEKADIQHQQQHIEVDNQVSSIADATKRIEDNLQDIGIIKSLAETLNAPTENGGKMIDEFRKMMVEFIKKEKNVEKRIEQTKSTLWNKLINAALVIAGAFVIWFLTGGWKIAMKIIRG